MNVGLEGSGCEIELKIIKQTDKAYQISNPDNIIMWFPKSAFTFKKELTSFGYKLYKEKLETTPPLEKEEEKTESIQENKESIINKHDHFTYELNFIKSENIRNWTIKAIDCLPDYIFTIPASSTGKYHPQFTLGPGGLLRHIKAATRFAIHLFTINNFTDEEQDIIISGLLLHDGGKSGIEKQSPFTRHDHPLLICDHLRNQEFFNDISQSELICDGIKSHMGQWQKVRNSKIILPLPETEIQKFIHQCDYLAAFKSLDFKFDE